MAGLLSAQSMVEPNPHYRHHQHHHHHHSTSKLRRSGGSSTSLVDYRNTDPAPSRTPLKLQTENLPSEVCIQDLDQSRSAPSTATSSPIPYEQLNRDGPSIASTPASSVSLDAKEDGEDDFVDDDISFPSYGIAVKPLDRQATFQPESPQTVHQRTHEPSLPVESLAEQIPILRRSGSTSSGSPAEDDTSMRHEPSRHVDYLSHEWKEEDIWSSWRYITSRRKQYGNSSRLENASWRTWGKTKHRLSTVSPAKLNWYVLIV